MPKFSYIAKTSNGENKKGTITANSQDIAITTLQSHGLIVLGVQDITKKSIFGRDIEFFNRVSAREMVIFSRLLATLLEVQVPLVEAISLLKNQQKKDSFFANTLEQVANDVQGGKLLSEALAQHPKVFGQLYVAMVQSGEASGGLQEALLFMADYLEEQYDLNNKIKGALMYPIFVSVIFLIIGVGVAYFVLPSLIEVLKSFNDVELPWTTKVIIWITEFIQTYIFALIAIFVLISAGIYYYFRTPAGQKVWDKWQLKLPVFGDLFTKVYIARFADNMNTLLKGGIPILRSLQISSGVVGNSVFQRILQEAMDDVKAGAPFSKALLANPEFPNIAAQMVRIGEKTGKIGDVLETLARFYKKEVDNVVNNLTTLIEPVMIVVLGIGVAIFVLSVLMPIYNVTGSL